MFTQGKATFSQRAIMFHRATLIPWLDRFQILGYPLKDMGIVFSPDTLRIAVDKEMLYHTFVKVE